MRVTAIFSLDKQMWEVRCVILIRPKKIFVILKMGRQRPRPINNVITRKWVVEHENEISPNLDQNEF